MQLGARPCCSLAPCSDDEAAFTVIAAIGLQGIRLAQPTLGEAVVVTGLGLIGLLTVQMLRAQGCRVLGIDFDPTRLALARQFGADVVDLAKDEDPIVAAVTFSRGRGVDAAYTILGLVCIEIWCREFMDKALTKGIASG